MRRLPLQLSAALLLLSARAPYRFQGKSPIIPHLSLSFSNWIIYVIYSVEKVNWNDTWEGETGEACSGLAARWSFKAGLLQKAWPERKQCLSLFMRAKAGDEKGRGMLREIVKNNPDIKFD